jgi:hypothetical protein
MPDLVPPLFHFQFLVIVITSIIIIITFNLCDKNVTRTVNTEWIQDSSELGTMWKESAVT